LPSNTYYFVSVYFFQWYEYGSALDLPLDSDPEPGDVNSAGIEEKNEAKRQKIHHKNLI
jgi:hypothetical protein